VLPIVWRTAARDDLATIIRYIVGHNPPAARRLKAVIEDAVLPLTKRWAPSAAKAMRGRPSHA
jgi:toxin ParE1/3/4